MRNATAGSLLLIAVISGASQSQASGAAYFLPAGATVDGVITWDTRYQLMAHLGEVGGGVGGKLSGSGYSLEAGFVPVISEPVTGTVPWPMTVRPDFVDLNPQGLEINLSLHGAELDIGGIPGIKVAGVPAQVVPFTKAQVAFFSSMQAVPGWHRLDVTTQKNTSVLPRGFGVRPLLTLEDAAAPDRTIRLCYHGNIGDHLYLAVSLGQAPWPTRVSPFHHVILLEPNSVLFLGVYPVASPTGRLKISFPPVGFVKPLKFQGLVLSSRSAYAPGCFTNLLTL